MTLAAVPGDARSPMTLPVARWALIALHIPYLVHPVVNVATEAGEATALSGSWWLAVVLNAAGVLLQLRHSLAAADGRRPAAWPLTLIAVTLIAVLPLPWWGLNWAIMLWLVGASSLQLLPRNIGGWVIVGVLVVGAVASWGDWQNSTSVQLAYWILNWVTATLTFTVVPPAAAVLVRVLADVRATQGELAAQAVQTERTRVGRDLHDLIGQSLSAVSLKGDLALRLLAADPAAAHREIASLTEAARTALRQIRELPRRQPVLSLNDELDGAAALLTAVGVALRLSHPIPALSQEVEQVLAWAVREGTTNVLRHSDATVVDVTFELRTDGTTLEMRNNHARTEGSAGSGLRGLEGRATALGGTARGLRQPDGWFVLTVDLPARTR